MNGAERVRALLCGEPTDRVGFWPGNPLRETKDAYAAALGIDRSDPITAREHGPADVELAVALGSDFFWCSPELDPLAWRHPDGRPLWDVGPKKSLAGPGPLAGCESVREIEAFPWPDPHHLDFAATRRTAEYAAARGLAVAGGMWMPYFHVVADLFGMEDYFVAMLTRPAVVEAATEHVLDFYLDANARCLVAMGDLIDAVFFGNDLGSQRDLLVAPEQLERFVLPGIRRIVAQAHAHGKPVILHSCGAIARILPRLVDAGIDALHPLQARAAGMDAASLARDFGGRLLFIGGIDTQQILPFETPAAVAAEVQRVISLLGDRCIVSPSHEALLPNVPLANVLAMRDAALASHR